MYTAIRLQIGCPDQTYRLYNGHLLSCAVLDAIPHSTAVMEDLCDIHSNADTLKSYFFPCHKVFIFISSQSIKCIKKKYGETGSCGASVSTVKITSLNLVPLFGYYTFINNQISVQRLQASEPRERGPTAQVVLNFSLTLTKQVILLITWLSSQPDITHFEVVFLPGCGRIGSYIHDWKVCQWSGRFVLFSCPHAKDFCGAGEQERTKATGISAVAHQLGITWV